MSIIQGDSLTILKTIESESIDCCITSPPYWGLRDYGVDEQLGLEKTPEEYVAKMVEVFREVKRVLKKEGTLWLNLGDTYSGTGSGQEKSPQAQGKQTDGQFFENVNARNLKSEWVGLPRKNLVGIPWRVAFALQADGWYLRQDIIWHKPNPMPESVTDRCTKSHEYIFLLAKSQKYYFEPIQEVANYDGRRQERMRGSTKYANKELVPGGSPHTFAARGHKRWRLNDEGERIRNKRSVWTVTTKPFKEAHFATFPEDLIIPMVKAGCPEKGIVLDPFLGSGTTGVVAEKLGRHWVGIELNPEYIKIANDRIGKQAKLL